LLQKINMPSGGGLDLKICKTFHKLMKSRPQSYDDCLRDATLKFETYFVNKTKQLLHNFPLDHKTDDKGTLFWSSPKRPPTELKFDWEDPTHRLFVLSLASLIAFIWKLPISTDEQKKTEKLWKL